MWKLCSARRPNRYELRLIQRQLPPWMSQQEVQPKVCYHSIPATLRRSSKIPRILCKQHLAVWRPHPPHPIRMTQYCRSPCPEQLCRRVRPPRHRRMLYRISAITKPKTIELLLLRQQWLPHHQPNMLPHWAVTTTALSLNTHRKLLPPMAMYQMRPIPNINISKQHQMGLAIITKPRRRQRRRRQTIGIAGCLRPLQHWTEARAEVVRRRQPPHRRPSSLKQWSWIEPHRHQWLLCQQRR